MMCWIFCCDHEGTAAIKGGRGLSYGSLCPFRTLAGQHWFKRSMLRDKELPVDKKEGAKKVHVEDCGRAAGHTDHVDRYQHRM